MTVSKIPWKRVLRKFVVPAHFVHKQVKIFLHVLCICEKLQWNGRWIQSKGNVLYFSFRVFINHSVRKAVIPAFFLKTFHFFLRNLVVAYMWQTGRHFERKVLVYESLKPEKQKTPFNFQRLTNGQFKRLPRSAPQRKNYEWKFDMSTSYIMLSVNFETASPVPPPVGRLLGISPMAGLTYLYLRREECKCPTRRTNYS